MMMMIFLLVLVGPDATRDEQLLDLRCGANVEMIRTRSKVPSSFLEPRTISKLVCELFYVFRIC